MNDIEAKALALVNKIEREEGEKELTRGLFRGLVVDEALCRALEQHEAFKQEVSDALEEYKADQPYVWKQSASDYFDRFIIPKPKPDPLVEAIEELNWLDPELSAKHLRAVLEARGLEIREKGQ
jgi:hypothetical protein